MTRKTVNEELGGGVLVLELNRPRQKNAFNHEMYCDLRDALADAQDSDSVRCVIVTGAEGAFSAGQDLGEMGGTGGDGTPTENPFGSFMDRLIGFDKPLIAAVNGVGVGIGLTLLLHCDVVYISRGARLRAPFVTLGVVPEAASSYLLPALIGYRNAIEVFFESDFITAERTVELGIANTLCEPDQLLPAARAHAARLAAKPLGSLRYTKRILLAVREESVRAARAREDVAFTHRVGSPENIEAIQSFFAKREPDFSKVPSHDRKDRP